MFSFTVFHSNLQTHATSLYMASENGYHYIVQSLLGAGAGVNIARSDVSCGAFDSGVTIRLVGVCKCMHA